MENTLEKVYAIIKDRRANPKDGSYVNYLQKEGVDKICKKIGEESAEVIIAAKNNDKKETSLGEINKSLKEPEPGDWKVKISAVKVSGNIKIKANFENDYYINVPGKFTPDGDGKNDIFKIETYNISEIVSFTIYNKWGELVFSSKKIDEGWDGKVNNELQKPDAYVYIIKAKTVSGHDVSKIGDVFLESKSLKN